MRKHGTTYPLLRTDNSSAMCSRIMQTVNLHYRPVLIIPWQHTLCISTLTQKN